MRTAKHYTEVTRINLRPEIEYCPFCQRYGTSAPVRFLNEPLSLYARFSISSIEAIVVPTTPAQGMR
jgi:hypothetical protein